MNKNVWKVIVVLVVVLLMASVAYAGTLSPSYTDFEEADFVPGETVHNHMPDGTESVPAISFTHNCQQAWFVLGAGTRDEEIVDVSGTFPDYGKVWRFSDAMSDGNLGQTPHSPNSGTVHGETGSFSDAGCGLATTADYYAEFEFRSATGDAQIGYMLATSASAKDTRQTYARIRDDGGGYDLEFVDTVDGCNFNFTLLDLNLTYTDWHRLGVEVAFQDGLASGTAGAAGAEGNDVVKVYIDNNLVHTGTTWESCVGARGIESLMFDHPVINAANIDGGLYIDNVLVTETCVDGHCIADDQGPVTSNTAASPNPVAVNAAGTVTANVDDSTTGGSNIAAAEYSLAGATMPMDAQVGGFDNASEDVTAGFTAPDEAGIYDLCVSGKDAAGNTGPEECVMLVVYDPSGGFVTGGGWIDSPAGAAIPRPDGTTIVSPSNMHGWAFVDDNLNGGAAQMVAGPGSPPIGAGSANFILSNNTQGMVLALAAYQGVRLDSISNLEYSTYRTSGSPAQAASLQFNVDYDVTDDDNSFQGRLVFEPYYTNVVQTGAWQTWNPLDSSGTGNWWATRAPYNSICSMGNPCTWEEVLAEFSNVGIHPTLGTVILKAGSGWVTFDGNADALTIGVEGEDTTYDFEPEGGPIGKANFGFVAKYKNGANVPDGNTEFVFNAADLNFHSTSYEWLVVTGNNSANFKGEGTINGEGNYKFKIWAGDGNPDTFRIRIWVEDNGGENVVYDNGANQPIGGGNIVVHKK